MGELLDQGHAVIVDPLEDERECKVWYQSRWHKQKA